MGKRGDKVRWATLSSRSQTANISMHAMGESGDGGGGGQHGFHAREILPLFLSLYIMNDDENPCVSFHRNQLSLSHSVCCCFVLSV
jgi:hypothetical protein